MRNSRMIIPLLSLAAVLLISGNVFGVSSYTTSFNARYGTAAGTALGSGQPGCTLCHPNGNTSQYTSYANDFRNNSRNYATIEPLDSDRDGFSNIAEINALTLPHDANSRPTTTTDTTAPTVTFSIPASSTTLTVPVLTFTASDNVAVTGYMITETSARPAASAAGWAATAPTSYAFASAGTKILYAWAKDAAGNVSASRSASVTITLADTTRPTVSAFAIPATSTTLAVPITSFTATDNAGGTGVTGYMVTESATAPAASAAGWTATAPTSYAFAGAGTKILYAWAKDGAGNVSTSRSASVTITLPDTTPPTVTGFSVSAVTGSLRVSITGFTATDNVGVTGYMATESPTAPAALATGWTATAPASYSFAIAGAKTLYAWAKDAAGNVSNSLSQTVTVSGDSGVDVESPEVMEFTLPLTSASLTVPIIAFRAIDNVGPTAYLITTTPTAPLANDAGWRATAPTSYTFTSAGAKTLYGWAKDAAGNVSESVWDNVDITLPPPTTSYTLSVSRAGTGSGTVASSPSGISCGSDCSQSYTAGTTVTLSATPASGSVFAGWSGACTGTGACTVTLSAARSVTATFNTAPAGSVANISAPSSYSFGETDLNSSRTRTIAVGNTGTATLRVTGVAKSGTDAGMFTVGASSFSVAPGATYNLSVTFSPTSEGRKYATLRISSNDPDTAVWQISLSGEGDD